MRVVLIDRRKLVREGLAQLIGTQNPDLVIAGMASTFAIPTGGVDAMIVGEVDGDQRPPKSRAVLVRLTPAMTVDELVAQVRRMVARRARYGDRVAGDVIAPADELSGRQREILRLISTGMTADEIASSLSLSRSTVEHHKQLLFARGGVRSQSQAVARWIDVSRAVDA